MPAAKLVAQRGVGGGLLDVMLGLLDVMVQRHRTPISTEVSILGGLGSVARGSPRGSSSEVTQLVPAFDNARDLGVEVVEEALHVAQARACGRIRPAGGLDALARHVCQLPVSRLLGPAGCIPGVVGQTVQV